MVSMLDIAKIKSGLPEKLIRSAENTLKSLQYRYRFTVNEEAMYWNTVAIAYYIGKEIALETSMSIHAGAFEKLMKGGK